MLVKSGKKSAMKKGPVGFMMTRKCILLYLFYVSFDFKFNLDNQLILAIAMKVVNIGCFFLAGYYFRPAAQDEKGGKSELAKTETSTDTSSVPSTDL